MLSLFALCLSLVGQQGAGPPPPPNHGSGWLLPPEIAAFDRDLLERARNRGAGMREMIEMSERHLRESPNLFTPKEAARLRQAIETWREDLQFMQQLQRELELYQQQLKLDPGLEPHRAYLERSEEILREWKARQKARQQGVNLAPPPREKK
jgi:hypothetical protein